MALTTVPACKAFRGIPGDVTEHDDELARLITAVQEWLERECERTFEQATVTEYYHGQDWTHCLIVARPPIVSVTNLWDDPLRVYTTPLTSSLYAVPVAGTDDANAGIIRLDGYKFQAGIQNIKITYTGGFQEIPPDLEQAAIEMVWAAREKGAHNLVGVRSRSIADGSVQFVNLGWESLADGIIRKYRLRTGVH
jgi:hypothetical protein